MSAFYIAFLAETALYAGLGYVAIEAARIEKHEGRDHAYKHLWRAALAYFGLAACCLLQNL
jgi:hypothetical protein